MPFITAHRIHNGHGWTPEGTVIEIAADGTIVSIGNGPGKDALFYEGVLAPGFVNVHCHLELSHMKGQVPEQTGLIPFLKTIPLHRNDFTEEQKKNARHAAYAELLANGVVATGDIANTTDTLDVRGLDGMHIHTFIEAIGFSNERAEMAYTYATQNHNAYAAQPAGSKLLRQSIVPHAPYSVSAALFRKIGGGTGPLSIHNQESAEEDKFYRCKEGGVRDLLQALGINDAGFEPTGKSSLQSYVSWLGERRPFTFVHNTYTTREDVQYAHQHLPEVYWCLCPNANLYIENKLPDIDMLMSEGADICIGTDSLASNHQLSILTELCSIRERFAHVGWETLLVWATHNGACALQMQDIAGSIEVGMKPGILQLTLPDGPSSGPASVNRIC